MGSSQEQHCSTHIPSHLQEEPAHAGFMGSSKDCCSPCLTLQSRWYSISQTAGAGSIPSSHSFASAGHTLLGKGHFPQPGEKHKKVVAGPRWEGCCSTLFFPHFGFFHSCPSLLHTSSMPRPHVGTDRFHAPGGKATALASGLIHTTLGRATLLLPDFRTKLAHKSR